MPKEEKEDSENIMTDANFFMMIEDPLLARRNLLEASKSTLLVIKGLYEMSEAREKKQIQTEAVRNQVREIRLLLQKAEELLPKYSRTEAAKRFPQLSPDKKKEKAEVESNDSKNNAGKKKKKDATPLLQRKLSDAERVKEAMNRIDSKINSLPKIKSKEAHKEFPKETSPWAEPAPKTSGDISFELGRTLESIQKKLKDM